MKLALKILLLIGALVFAFLAGVQYERIERTEKVMAKWQKLYSWTDEEGRRFPDSLEGLNLSPEEVASIIGNMARFTNAAQAMMENEISVMVAACYAILKLVEQGKHSEVREFCLSRIESYYKTPHDKLPESIREGNEALKRRIEALAEEIPDLRDRIEGN